jgi:hypothetical protein
MDLFNLCLIAVIGDLPHCGEARIEEVKNGAKSEVKLSQFIFKNLLP